MLPSLAIPASDSVSSNEVVEAIKKSLTWGISELVTLRKRGVERVRIRCGHTGRDALIELPKLSASRENFLDELSQTIARTYLRGKIVKYSDVLTKKYFKSTHPKRLSEAVDRIDSLKAHVEEVFDKEPTRSPMVMGLKDGVCIVKKDNYYILDQSISYFTRGGNKNIFFGYQNTGFTDLIVISSRLLTGSIQEIDFEKITELSVLNEILKWPEIEVANLQRLFFHSIYPFHSKNHTCLLMGTEFCEISTLLECNKEIYSGDFLIAAECFEAVSQLIRVGYLHCDLKPDNFLLYFDPIASRVRPRLCDFGWAKSVNDSSRGQRGFPGFAAPEAVQSGVHTPASELCSTAMTCCYFLLGLRFYGSEDNKFKCVSETINKWRKLTRTSVLDGVIDVFLAKAVLRGKFSKSSAIFSELVFLMHRCTAFKSGNRPNFSEVIEKIKRFSQMLGANRFENEFPLEVFR